MLLAGTVVADGPPAEVLTAENLQTAFGERAVTADAAGHLAVFDDHGHGDQHGDGPDHPRVFNARFVICSLSFVFDSSMR